MNYPSIVMVSRFSVFAALSFGIALAGGCTASSEGLTACGSPCKVSSACPDGQFCDNGCCAPIPGCTPTSCGPGAFCDQDGQCKTTLEKCSAEPCECHMLNSVGEFDPRPNNASAPRIVVPGGTSIPVEPRVMVANGGPPLEGATFALRLADGSAFSVEQGTMTLTAKAGAAGFDTLTADAGSGITCTAQVVNLGPNPDGAVRLLVLNDQTGEGVGGAEVVVQSRDGVELERVYTTDHPEGLAHGLATFAEPAGPFDVTVFASGYNYLSIVGLDAITSREIVLPLAPRPTPLEVGGFTGKLNFETYEEMVLGGMPRLFKAGLVLGSLPLQGILNFDLSTVLGPIASAEQCEAHTISNKVAGCYALDAISLIPKGTVIPLPGGVVLGTRTGDVKSFFEAVARPGRRMAWATGVELNLTDLPGVLAQLSPYLMCTCDAQEDVCEESCKCDLDCGLKVDLGVILDDVVPLLSQLGSASMGNIPLSATSFPEWKAHTENPDYERRSVDDRYPRLDDGAGGGYGSLVLREATRLFTDYGVPALPPDVIDKPGEPGTKRAMEGMALMTGVHLRGFGFVPLGLGLGLDCTTGDCLSRVGNPDGFDGVVNGSLVCKGSNQAGQNQCAPGMPAGGRVADGHVGLFRAPAHSGLETGEWMTVALAFPLASFLDADDEGGAVRVAGVVTWGQEPPTGSGTLSGTFPSIPAMGPIVGRRYSVEAQAGAHIHWVTFATAGSDDGPTTRWNVFFPKTRQGLQFTAPVPSLDIEDPLSDPDGDGKVNTTHVAFAMRGDMSLAELAANNGTTLADLVAGVEGFALQSQDMVAVSQ